MKKVLSILLIIMIIITIIQIQSTYAMYKDVSSGGYSIPLGNWQIKVNNTLISRGGNQIAVFNIPSSSVKYVESENVTNTDQNGNVVGPHLIAPGSEAYFYLTIDPRGTDVPVKYTIEINNNPSLKGKTTPLSDVNFEITKVMNTSYLDNITDMQPTINLEKKAGEFVNINKSKITDIVPMDEVKLGKLRTYTIYFKWINDDENNYEDYNNPDKRVSFSLPITVRAEQYYNKSNILDGQNIGLKSGYYYDGSGDSSGKEKRFIRMEPVTVKPNTTYKFSSNLSIYSIWYFNENEKIEKLAGGNVSEKSFTTPANCTKLRISLNNTSGEADTTAFEWATLEEIESK